MFNKLSYLFIFFIFIFLINNFASLDKFDNLQIKDNEVHVKNNFENLDLDHYDAATINNIFSEKHINYDLQTKHSIKKYNTGINYNIVEIEKNNELNEIRINKNNKEVQLTNVNWKKNFSNKKIKFIETVLPLIIYENQKILAERNHLFEIKQYLLLNKTLKQKDMDYLYRISKKYKIDLEKNHKIDVLNELLISVDIIPRSIVLAQAANESGWGTSRFAKEYNALFGQYTYDEKNGVIPRERTKGQKHLIKSFSTINQSVESYFKNINTHYAYKKFRKLRSKLDNKAHSNNIKLLINNLNVYAEDKSYIKIINSIIDTNNFEQFDEFNFMFPNS